MEFSFYQEKVTGFSFEIIGITVLKAEDAAAVADPAFGISIPGDCEICAVEIRGLHNHGF